MTLRDGRRFSDRRAVAHGHPSDPLDDRELTDKFLRLASPLLGERDAAAFAEALLSGPLDTPAAAVLEPVTRARGDRAADDAMAQSGRRRRQTGDVGRAAASVDRPALQDRGPGVPRVERLVQVHGRVQVRRRDEHHVTDR